MKKLFFGMLAMAGLLMGSCTADDGVGAQASDTGIQADGGTGGGNGINPPPPPPPPRP